MNAAAIATAVRRPKTLLVAAAGLATAASLFAGAWTASADSPTLPSAPSAPQNVEARAGDGNARVRWESPESDGGSPILYYTVVSDPGAVSATTTDAEELALKVKGLENGTEYTFTVTATNAAGASQPSAPSNSVTPHPRPDLDQLIEKLHSHFQRAIENAEAHAAHAGEHAQDHAAHATERAAEHANHALGHAEDNMKHRTSHLMALAEKAEGTKREAKVKERVDKAIAEMEARAGERRQAIEERLAERQARINERLGDRLNKIEVKLKERKARIEERHEKHLDELKDR